MTKNLSIPSEKFIVVDAPEVTSFQAKFVYNRFVPDEKENDSGVLSQDFVQGKSLESFDSEMIDSPNFNRFVPRYNKLTWTPVDTNTHMRQSGFTGKIKNNLDKIYNESFFASERFSNISFGSSVGGQNVEYFIERLVGVAYKDEEIDDQESLMDRAKHINNITSEDITGDFIEKSLRNSANTGHWNIDEKTHQNISRASREASFGEYGIQVNNKFVSKVTKTSISKTTNVTNSATNKLAKQLDQVQNEAVANNSNDSLFGSNYDFDMDNIISAEPIDTQFEPVVHVVGYIISKTEITANGDQIEHEPLVIESPSVNSAVDLKIKYGSTYQYSIQSVALVKFQAEDVEENEIVAASILVSSRSPSPEEVVCEEFVPPPPPIDIEARWDYNLRKPVITWNFPVNPQQDIKYFQVFSRRSVDEPFMLEKMYDFDDSLIKAVPREAPSEELIERLPGPNNRFVDYDFYDGDKKIFAVCSVDAHGLSSGYSTQFMVSFDGRKNKIDKVLISRSGAPKPYPNLFLSRDAFVDSIKTSGYGQVKVVFNPEYLEVYDIEGNDLEVIKGKEMDKYQLQLINIDLQEQQVFNISIDDKRKSKSRKKRFRSLS